MAVQDCAGSTGCNTLEVEQRLSEWERRMGTLDEEGVTLQHMQLKLVRDQVTSLTRDVANLRQTELNRASPELQRIDHQDLEALRQQLQDTAKAFEEGLQRVASDVSATMVRVEEVVQHGDWPSEARELRRLISAERLAREQVHSSVQDSMQRHHAYSKMEQELRHSNLEQRLEWLEAAVGPDHHWPDQTLPGEAISLGTRLRSLEDGLERAAPLEDRLGILEASLAGAVKQQSQALENAQALVERVQGRMAIIDQLAASCQDVKDRQTKLSQDKAAIDAHQAWSKERVDRLEDELSAASADLKERVSALDARFTSVSETLQERIAKSEKACTDTSKSHGRELDNIMRRLEQMRSRVSEHHATLTQQAAAQTRLLNIERVLRGYLEGVTGEGTGREVAMANAAHATLVESPQYSPESRTVQGLESSGRRQVQSRR